MSVPSCPQDKNSIHAATAAAANSLASSLSSLVSGLVSNTIINTTSALGSNTNSVSPSQYSSYLTCLLTRANGARFSFSINKHSTPSSNYIAAAKAASSKAGSSAQSNTRRRHLASSNPTQSDISSARRLSDVTSTSKATTIPATVNPGSEKLAGYSNGYPIYSALLEAYGRDMRNLPMDINSSLASHRTVGVNGNLLLGGVLFHQVRNAIDAVSVQPWEIGAYCRSHYSHLLTECLARGSNLQGYTFMDNGRFGMDPVFYNRSTLFNPDLSSESECASPCGSSSILKTPIVCHFREQQLP